MTDHGPPPACPYGLRFATKSNNTASTTTNAASTPGSMCSTYLGAPSSPPRAKAAALLKQLSFSTCATTSSTSPAYQHAEHRHDDQQPQAMMTLGSELATISGRLRVSKHINAFFFQTVQSAANIHFEIKHAEHAHRWLLCRPFIALVAAYSMHYCYNRCNNIIKTCIADMPSQCNLPATCCLMLH